MRIAQKTGSTKTGVSDYVSIRESNPPGEFNLLALRVWGQQVQVYFNGQLCLEYTLQDTIASTNNIGLFACTCDGTDDAEVYFDNFSLTLLK